MRFIVWAQTRGAALRRSLVANILLVVGITGAISLLAMGLFATRAMEKSLVSESHGHLSRLIDSTSKGLQTIMLAGYADIAQGYADNLKEVEGLVDFSILRVNGHEAFQDNKTIKNVNKRRGEEEFLPRPTEKVVEVLPGEHKALVDAIASRQPVSYLETSGDGLPLETYLVPIENQKECTKCHGADHAVRGIIKLTTSLAGREMALAELRVQMLIVLVVAVSGFLVLLGWILRSRLGIPLNNIRLALEAMTNGNLVDRLTPSRSRDELTVIAQHINQLADNLAHNIRTINLHAGSISAFVREILNLRGALGEDSVRLRGISGDVDRENQVLGQEFTAIGQRIFQASGRMEIITSSATQVSDTILSMAQSAGQANNEVATMAAKADEMIQRVDSVDQSLQEMAKATEFVSREVEEMRLSLGEVGNQCQEASQQSDNASRRAQVTLKVTSDLSHAAREIGQVVTLIKDVAARTNLLALNAAIEAAQAGEMGKGFGVVAAEVKALSNQTVEATQTIARLVESIQGKTRNASSEVAEITTLVDRITQANREIAGAVAEQTRSIGRIAESVQQVAKATGSVLANAQQMAQVARQVDEGAVRTTSSTAEIARLSAQSAASADDMRAKSEEAFTFSQAIQESLQRTEKASGVVGEKIADSVSVVNAMQGSVNHFRSLGDVASNISDALLAAQSNLDVGVEPFDVRLMKEVHLKLLGRLERAANGLDQLTREEIGDGPSCPLGQWITGAGAEMLGDAVLLAELRDVHNLTHQTAQDVFNYLAMGERSAAMNAVRLFHELRASLFELLNRIYLGETKQPDHSQPWMEWHDRFTLGIPALDQDHQEMIAQLVVIYRAFATNSGMAVILQHLDRFVQITSGHFVREEEVMGRQGYPDLKNHKQEHAFFLKKIEEFIHKMRRENLPFSQEMALYMKNWLTQHLQGEDSRFVHFANRKGKG